jgi:8-oxo-dGTP pyrophosphatase MutT (NUDIX family)
MVMSSLKILNKAGGVVLQSKTHNIAVITNDFGQYVLPKGGIELGETYEAAARREVAEETGLEDLILVRKLGILQRPGHTSATSKNIDVVKRIHLFLFTTEGIEITPIKQDSLAGAWVAPRDLANILTWREELQFIEQYCPELF